MNIFNMCSIPVFSIELSGHEKITKKEYDVLTQFKMEKRDSELKQSTMLSESSCILENENLKNIKFTKQKYIDYYLKNILKIKNNFSMTSSWLTMNYNGSSHERHSHGNVILSSVLYFCEDLKEDVMSNFYISQNALKDVFKTFQFTYDLSDYNEYNSPSLTLATKTNFLVIFPAWMLHGSEPAEGPFKRYCIGSNYFLNDHVGSGYHSLQINSKLKDTSLQMG